MKSLPIQPATWRLPATLRSSPSTRFPMRRVSRGSARTLRPVQGEDRHRNCAPSPGEGPGKVVLVSAMSPTPAGEGKSTCTVGLADSLARAGRSVMIALREPSLGSVLGMKGGATGGGYSQVLPMDEINLHFTGDFHAITSANNALMALIDNHIYQGNELDIDPRRITFKRVLDMNDRALREVVIGLGGPTQGTPRQDGFDITVASEIMAVFCLASDLDGPQGTAGRITFGYTFDRRPVTVRDLRVAGALALLLKDAIKPNLVQTIAGTPALVHGGPFANIAHGCNSVIATTDGPAAGGHRCHRGGLRRRPRCREVHGHQGARTRMWRPTPSSSSPPSGP